MNHGQAFAAFSADGFGERMFEDFRDWVNEPDQTSPTTGYYLRGDDGFRYIDGETP